MSPQRSAGDSGTAVPCPKARVLDMTNEPSFSWSLGRGGVEGRLVLVHAAGNLRAGVAQPIACRLIVRLHLPAVDVGDDDAGDRPSVGQDDRAGDEIGRAHV